MQRVRVFGVGVDRVSKGGNVVQDIASLLFEAVVEAGRWGLLRFGVWGPSSDVVDGVKLLGKKLGLEVESGEQGESVPSLRWNGASEKSLKVLLNEHFAWT